MKNLHNKYFKYILQRAFKEPHLILPATIALLNGYFYKILFFCLRKKVKIGKLFRVYGSFNLSGCGKVEIGDNCFFTSKIFRKTSLITTTSNAFIKIGNNVGLSGTVLQCSDRIIIEDWCNIADAYIVDSSAHHLSAKRRDLDNQSVPKESVHISKNVWISTNVTICKGVFIGQNSVIGACSLIRKNIPANSFYAGIPAQFIKKIPN
ncbi:putative Galactoside acetyltransferase [Desulfamplus magnetovallimortis]|uniref:Putative Galactoside acetyltransferase n=1 Tax=Desulfamplus magnetovallimortis TaxID=1246637 RepID=A0A1W1HKW0_9BACT|nr:acyltransferase [Desulfamplus magnetovallimortis]SLM33147.1 putative Galactoside acetyltransferase [Desulfamplus magnetovallimortis]